MDKFEEYFRTTKHYKNMLLEIARNQLSVSVFDKSGRKYRNHIVQTAYEVFQHQQVKVEELDTHAQEIHKREIKLFEKTLILTHERDELQKQINELKEAMNANKQN